MVTINQLAQISLEMSKKDITINNIKGQEFIDKYGFKCPEGVRGRNSDNTLYKEKMGVEFDRPLYEGVKETFEWINKQLYK